MCTQVFFTILLVLLCILNSVFGKALPHIVIILADDLGWNDVSFHGSNEFQTPNIDALAYSGVILHNHYTQPLCTPARAALLTGRHPISNGMHHNVIYASQPWGLPLSETLMPQYLKTLGYVTRAVGKWHLGFFKADYTPTRRGFDSHFGTWLGHQDHFTYITDKAHSGYDLHRDLCIAWEGRGKYSADLFTEETEGIIRDHNSTKPLFLYLAHTAPHAPLQAPQETIAELNYISGKRRQTYAAMITKVDESVGRVVQALKDKDMLNNSIILFLSDNGGATKGYNGNVASNWPLKGKFISCAYKGKDTLWEGGVRGVGLIWSPLLNSTPRVHHGLINIQDWLPTLIEAAGGLNDESLGTIMSQLDGTSQWQALNGKSEPPYHTMLHNIDPRRMIAAIRDGKWKLTVGRTHRGWFDGWFGEIFVPQRSHYNLNSIRNCMVGQILENTLCPLPSDNTILHLRSKATISCASRFGGNRRHRRCHSHSHACLFNIEHDPCELHNLASSHPNIVRHMLKLLLHYHPVKSNYKRTDPRGYPCHWNNTWTTWGDYIHMKR